MIVEKQGGCKTGEAVITTAGNLLAKFVIHTVGPIWNGGKKNEDELLVACYQNSLNLAIKHKLNSIAFPNISTGIYGYPKKEAAEIATRTTIDFLKNNSSIEKLLFVCFDIDNYLLYESILAKKG
jgi:O-acetyl-ADP-ribose deacetylase (regulator of RNase III)